MVVLGEVAYRAFQNGVVRVGCRVEGIPGFVDCSEEFLPVGEGDVNLGP